MATWTALTYAANSLLTSTKMTQNQANFSALAEGASGAPAIEIAALVSGTTTQTIYYSFSPASLVPETNTPNWVIDYVGARSATTTGIIFSGGVNLPHGAIVTSFKAYFYMADAGDSGNARLRRNNRQAVVTSMALATATPGGGYHAIEDTSISDATIDNQNYEYLVRVGLVPNGTNTDARFMGALITYTIAKPLP